VIGGAFFVLAFAGFTVLKMNLVIAQVEVHISKMQTETQ
jgi:hypothetical protein